MNQSWNYVPFEKLFNWKAKSQIKSGSGKVNGKYKMFVCSDTEFKRYDEYLETEESLVFGTGGKASCHYVNEPFAYSTDCIVAQKKSYDVFTKFYYYFFRQNCLNLLQSTFTGSGLQHTSKAKIEKILVPIISYEEQERVVSKIEELFSELDKGVETLKKVKKQIDVHKQIILKNAFQPFDEFTSFNEISTMRLGKMLDKQKNIGEYKLYLRNTNVRWYNFDLSDLLEMKIKHDEFDKYSVIKGDLIICEGGEPGRCAVWENEKSIFFQKALHRVRFFKPTNSKFFMYYLRYICQNGEISKFFTGTGIKHLTGQSLAKIPIPKVAKDVQDKTVMYIELHHSKLNNIERVIDTSLEQAECIRQSILRKAFE